MNDNKKEQDLENQKEVLIDEENTIDLESENVEELPEEASEEDTIKDLEDQLLRAKAEVQSCSRSNQGTTFWSGGPSKGFPICCR